MKKTETIKVFYKGRPVGTLAKHDRLYAAFAYSEEWLRDGFPISPLSLPLENRVFVPKSDQCEGLFGVFLDSLPDGWGRLLVDRLMRSRGLDPSGLGNLDRLSIVGSSGMGALTYEPEQPEQETGEDGSLDLIAAECEKILRSEEVEDLDYLFLKGGSSGGARPKILTKVDGEDWIIKFPSSMDRPSIGKEEYNYARCAAKCGIEMEDVRLFPSGRCEGYFGTRRFDRNGAERIHMVSAAGLLETTHRIPNLDYDVLMRLTLKLTDSMEECEKLYRRMCFNVFAHNRDDHSKNFTYQYMEQKKHWVLSPAYDLTYSNSLGGEHATSVHGNGKDPGIEDLIAVANAIGIGSSKAKQAAEEIQSCVLEELGEYLNHRKVM